MCPESEPAAASPFPVLIVDDDPVQCRLLETYIQRMGGIATVVHGVADAIRILSARGVSHFRAVILDLMMPDGSGLDVLGHLKAAGDGTPVIVQTAKAGLDTVVAAMRAGAFDFVVKPASPDKIRLAVEAALRTLKPAEVLLPAHALQASAGGATTPMGAALRAAAKAARSTIPVLLLGETGVGKEWLARRIVEAGPRARAPFVAVNCGALPRDLVESVLFGHERGAFTGAMQRHPGKFQEADGGTLFLDEVGELTPDTQIKLLRALQEGEIDPVGALSPVRTNVRIIAATHRDLQADMASSRFREDLFYRLHVFPITVPPLRERRGEIGPLATGFVHRFAGTAPVQLADNALRWLERQDWPGNIRQLENAVHRAVVLADGPVLGPNDFGGADADATISSPEPANPGHAIGAADGHQASPLAPSAFCTGDRPEPTDPRQPGSFLDMSGEIRSLDQVERDLIACAIQRYEGRLSTVARRLGIGRSTLYRKMRQHQLDRSTNG